MTVSQQYQEDTGRDTERRASRRREARFAAVVSTPGGSVTGRVADLSRTGACVEGDREMARLLLAAGRRTGASGMPNEVQLRFDLSAGGSVVPVSVQARVVYVMHRHDDTYRCGLEFRLFNEGEAVLAACLQAGTPAE